MTFRTPSWSRVVVLGLAVSAAVWSPCFGAAPDPDVVAGWEAYHRQDEEKALKLFKKAAARGSGTAYAGLGLLYFDGSVVEMNEAEAIRLYEKGAAANDPEAMMRLADWLRFDAEGRPADYKRARELLKRVIAAGGVDENENVRRAGEWLVEIEKTAPDGAVRLDAEKAAKELAADQRPGAEEYRRGVAHYAKVNYAMAADEWSRAAEKGYPAAFSSLAELYYNGWHVGRDLKEWRRLNAHAASLGDPAGMLALGSAWFTGVGGAVDEAQSKYWYEKTLAHPSVRFTQREKAQAALADLKDATAATTPLAVEAPRLLADFAKPQPKPAAPAPVVSREDMQWAVQLEERKKNGYWSSAAEDARYKAILAALAKPAGKPGQAEYDQAVAAANAGEADRAFMLLLLAAQAGHVEAMLEASTVFIQSGKPEGMKSGLFWLAKAAEAGEPEAVKRMGLLTQLQAGAEEVKQGQAAFEAKKYTEAVAFFKKAAESGSVVAPRLLGQLYEQGLGVEKNETEARRLYAEGVAREDADAFLNLAEVTRMGLGGPRDPAEAGRIYERLKTTFSSLPKAVEAADQGLAFLRGETVESALTLGSEAYQHQQMEEARVWMEKAANLGSAQGMFNMGVFYRDGLGGPRDAEKALAWFEKAQAGGWKGADKQVANLRATLAGKDALAAANAAQEAKRYAEARGLYEKAADAGSVEAMRKLGDIYSKGIAVIKDDDAALTWYERAAAAGDMIAKTIVESMRSNKQWRDAAIAQREARARVNGTGGATTRTTKTGPAVPFDSLIKNTPWTTAQIAAALKSGTDHEALAVALRTDGTEAFYDGDYRLLLATPEGAGIDSWGNLAGALEEKKQAGVGQWARDLASAAIAARKAQLKLPTPVADSAELRAKAKAGDPVALYELAHMPESARTFGRLTKEFELTYADWAKLMRRANYKPGFWLIGADLAAGSDETKKDPLAAVDYYRESAEAGSAQGAERMAGVFNEPVDAVVAPNFFEVEAWLIEAAARSRPGEFPIMPPEQRLYLLYSGANPAGYGSSMRADEEDLRWLRELQRRGGASRELATAFIDVLRRQNGDRVDVLLREMPPEVPAFSAAETARLEKAAASGDVAAMMKLADALATGRGLRQHDKRAVGYYQQAAERGDAHAMSRLAEHYRSGHGVAVSQPRRLEWLRKAAEAGDARASFDYASALVSAGATDKATVIVAAYEKALEGSVERAADQLANLYLYGSAGVEKNRDKALAVLLKEFGKGRTWHAGRIGLIYAGNRDDVNALVWLQKAWAAGDGSVGQELAQTLIRNGRRAEGLAILRRLSEQGNNTVQYLYAAYLAEDGKLDEAYAWNKRVAENPGALMRANAAKKVAEYEKSAPKPVK